MKIFVSFVLALLIFACRQETFTTNPDILLKPSVDTLHFDTVFTSIGSITQSFKIVNDNTKGIHVSSVQLAGGAASPFKINVAGQPGTPINNIDISGNDSAYVFVTVTINPTSINLPFVIRDSIIINYNSNKAVVQLEAYGQNAHFLRNKIVADNEIWNNDLPYVILNGLTIDSNAQLSIKRGCKIYLHADAPLIVNGTLQVTGEKWDSTRVVFTGDRLDDPYRDFPASWPGIVFSAGSKNNSLQYSIIKNAYQGIVVQDPAANANPKLIISQTVIDNAYDAGIIANHSSIVAQNLLITNCGANIVINSGGDYQFTHCTVASYANTLIQHTNPVLFVSNGSMQSAAVNNLTAVFRNCIFWGEGGLVNDEVVVAKTGTTPFNLLFDHVLWKVETQPLQATINGAINNQPPLFDSINTAKRYYSFRLKDSSPAINKGTAANVPIDLDGNPRPVGLPDLGCYEKQ